MRMAGPTHESDATRPGRAAVALAAILALGALDVSAYLLYTSIATGLTPAGCGWGSGCAEVLASKWSRVLGVPVSVLAMMVYVFVLAVLPASRSNRPVMRDFSRLAFSAVVAAIVGSAGWFIFIQLFLVKSVCPYCMAGHALGLLLSALLVWRFRARHVAAGLLGLAGVVLVIVVQANSPGVVATLEAPAQGTDTDTTTTTDGRTVTVLNGKLTLVLNDEPVLGDPGAKHVMALMYDYACPHCRHTHGVIHELLRDRPGLLAVVLLPTPLNHACNPHAPQELDARFDESCELARVALAVFLVERRGFADFDRWLYGSVDPRSAEEARAEAVRRVGRVGRENFEHAYLNPRMQQMIARNVHVYGQSGADRVPVLAVPGRAAVVGRVDGAGQLVGLLGAPIPSAPQ